MSFQTNYQKMNDPIAPSPALQAEVLAKTRRSARHHSLPRRVAAIAAAVAVVMATPALAAQTETGYRLLYAVSPAAAQFFQPVALSCTDQGVTVEVVSVHVEGGTAQAYIALSGGRVDETTDLYDSYSFNAPFDQVGHCQYVGWDEAAGTATFLCTVETMDGRDIATGGKMTFSLSQILTGRETLEDVAVEIDLCDYAAEAQTAQGYASTGSTGDVEASMLLPGEPLADGAGLLPVTAAGFADGYYHVQLRLGDVLRTDNHAWLWLEDEAGNRLDPVSGVTFRSADKGDPIVYEEFLFDLPAAGPAGYTLHGDFYTGAELTQGSWRITFPLENEF